MGKDYPSALQKLIYAGELKEIPPRHTFCCEIIVVIIGRRQFAFAQKKSAD